MSLTSQLNTKASSRRDKTKQLTIKTIHLLFWRKTKEVLSQVYQSQTGKTVTLAQSIISGQMEFYECAK